MTKSQNTENEQQKDLRITSEQLTEKYLNGNLHDGYEYFVKNKDGEISTMYLYNDVMHLRSFKIKKLKVLAPVPSYEEWQDADERSELATEYSNEIDELNEEIEKLKELLKKCSSYVGHSATSRMIKNSVGFKKDMKLLTKIDEVLK